MHSLHTRQSFVWEDAILTWNITNTNNLFIFFTSFSLVWMFLNVIHKSKVSCTTLGKDVKTTSMYMYTCANIYQPLFSQEPTK